jgi:ribosomal protein S18 acetylase RimI-like enzyme
MVTALDNPIWNAMTSAHRPMARINGRAARYPGEVSPLTGLADLTPQAFEDLKALVSSEEQVALFTTAPVDVPADWQVVKARYIDQMVCAEPPPLSGQVFVTLGPDDVADMLALTALTEPGPFAARTHEMGHYVGVRTPDGRLAAMTGQRLGLDDFTEISAVCTHPDFQGRGYAKALVAYQAARIHAEGRTPFLHVKTENGAKVVYEKLGFRVRRPIRYSVLARA